MYCLYGYAYNKEGKYKEALAKFRAAYNYAKSVGAGNDTLAFYLDLCGDAYFALGENEKTEKEYTRAQALADAHYMMGEKEAAVKCAKRAVDLDPTNEEYKEFYNKLI